MKIEKFVKDNISNLEHFIEQKGWPVTYRENETVDLIKIPGFSIKDGILHCDTKKIPTKIIAAFWKFKYMEAKSDANKLYNAIQEAYNKANSY